MAIQTYTALTGHSGGWTEFIGLLGHFYPSTDATGTVIQSAPMRCNPFPLLDNLARSTVITIEEVPGVATSSPGDSIVSISPGPHCPIDQYSWSWVDPNSHLELSVRPKAFGNPVVSWRVNGEALSASGGLVAVSGDADIDQPATPDLDHAPNEKCDSNLGHPPGSLSKILSEIRT